MGSPWEFDLSKDLRNRLQDFTLALAVRSQQPNRRAVNGKHINLRASGKQNYSRVCPAKQLISEWCGEDGRRSRDLWCGGGIPVHLFCPAARLKGGRRGRQSCGTSAWPRSQPAAGDSVCACPCHGSAWVAWQSLLLSALSTLGISPIL